MKKNKIFAAAVGVVLVLYLFVFACPRVDKAEKSGEYIGGHAENTANAEVQSAAQNIGDVQASSVENGTEGAKQSAEEKTLLPDEAVPDTVLHDEGQSAETTATTETDNTATTAKHTCTLSVTCRTILNNRERLREEKRKTVPADGVIFSEREVEFYEGESVFNVTLREMKRNKIHFEFTSTPIYHSAYIEGIANIYELDCGELSGWMYRVNGEFPGFGCSRYTLSDGDRVEWIYTCDLGRDIGGYFDEGGGQRDE